MSDLPKDRLKLGPPFTNVRLDFFGPWNIVTRRTKEGIAKYTRVVHIELIEELSSSAFINALRIFLSIRGEVK